MMSLELFIAKRYLFSKRSIRFINIITMISVVGITIGVAALLIVLSVFNGFSEIVTRVLMNFDPHIKIEQAGGMGVEEIQKIEHLLKSNKEVTAYSPFVAGKAMIISKNKNKVAYITGVDEKNIEHVSGLKDNIVLGSLTLNDPVKGDCIILGLTLADRLEALLGEEITVVSPNDLSTIGSAFSAPSLRKMTVTGFFVSSNREYDANYAYISKTSAQAMYHMGTNVSGMDIRLANFLNAEEIKSDIVKEMPSHTTVSTWQDLHKDLYFVMKLERWSGYVIISLIILVACFNLMGSLAMSIIEKKRDIGVLQTLGMTPQRIIKSFIFEGLLVGVAGTALGILLGLLVLYLQTKYQFFALDTSVYIIPAIPVKVEFFDFLSVAISSLGLSLLSAYYPARKISHYYPTECLRWE